MRFKQPHWKSFCLFAKIRVCSASEFHLKYLSCSYYECQAGDRETFWVVPWQIWDQSNKGPFDTLTPNKRMDLNHHPHRQGQGTTLILSPDICNDPADRWQKLALALDTWIASLLNSGSRISTSAKILIILCSDLFCRLAIYLDLCLSLVANNRQKSGDQPWKIEDWTRKYLLT